MRMNALAICLIGLSSYFATVENANAEDFGGLSFGVGLSLAFTNNGVNEAIVDGAGIVRSTKESKRVPKILLESHYFFVSNGGDKWFCPQSVPRCGQGPFVAIEAGAEGDRTISALGIGWMVGFARDDPAAANPTKSSWNFGIGYLVRTGVTELGDGIQLNQPLPANDTLRYKTVSKPGPAILVSFSF